MRLSKSSHVILSIQQEQSVQLTFNCFQLTSFHSREIMLRAQRVPWFTSIPSAFCLHYYSLDIQTAKDDGLEPDCEHFVSSRHAHRPWGRKLALQNTWLTCRLLSSNSLVTLWDLCTANELPVRFDLRQVLTTKLPCIHNLDVNDILNIPRMNE